MGDIITIILLFAALIAAVISLRRSQTKAKRTGGCAGCSGCRHYDNCRDRE